MGTKNQPQHRYRLGMWLRGQGVCHTKVRSEEVGMGACLDWEVEIGHA